MTAPNDKRSLPYGGSFAIMDPTIISSLPVMDQADSKTFCQKYLEWIASTKLNNLVGLSRYPYAAYSNGTTEAFDKFYMKNNKRRFRCFRGEYVYHQISWRTNWPDWKFLEDSPVLANDAVVISLPFSDTGNEHIQMKQVLKLCSILNVPVLIDCVYFGVCSNINFDFNYDCITDITFSLSKAFPLAYARVGMRLTKVDDDDALLMLHKIEYTNRIGAAIGIPLMEQYSPDYIVTKYRKQQIDLCNKLDIEPSNTVLFGIDKNNKYPEYNRGGSTNRLGLYRHLNV
jgi:hypothetical protein